MEQSYTPIRLNLGCGSYKFPDHINVDLYGDVDFRWDLDSFPYPWADNSIDSIRILHVLEHVKDWWQCFTECARILKPGGELHIRVPHYYSHSAITYRDHLTVFSQLSFHGIRGAGHGTSTWAMEETNTVPLVMSDYRQVPFKQYNWMAKWVPWLLSFCANHLNGFIWEQQFTFIKVGNDGK